MKTSDYLEGMPTFKNMKETSPIIYAQDKQLPNLIKEWADLLIKQKQKGFINLFLTGSGVSWDTVPNLIKIIEKLEKEYSDKLAKGYLEQNSDVENLFKLLLVDKRQDRSIVARLLNVFQEKKDLKEYVWQEMNKWLFNEIYDAEPTTFHDNLVKVSQHLDILSLTLNFDGLLIKSMLKTMINVKPFSLPTCEECENYYLRVNESSDGKKEFLEIQIRGDILYLICDSKSFCPQKGKKVPLWAYDDVPFNSEDRKKMLRRCPSCGDERYSLLSFPGSNEKENDMRSMLSIIWKYCAFRVGTVTTVGVSGKWDASIVAFLGDLLSERDVPLLVIEKEEEKGGVSNDSYIINELVLPNLHNSVCLQIGANSFMETFARSSDNSANPVSKVDNNGSVPDDKYWKGLTYESISKDTKLEQIYKDIVKSLDLGYSNLETNIDKAIRGEYLENFSQLGLKSHWLLGDNAQSGMHNRYNHSVGVMKIASYLYDRVFFKKPGIEINENERQFLRLAALLHDVGHLPFSHLIESVFQELNWKPAGYSDDYSHELQTEEKIKEIFSKPDLAHQLEQTGYYIDDLIDLVHGRFGIPYLDAIINGPLDADKIDYVFRDTDWTGRKISLSRIQFLYDIYDDISISPEKFLSISGVAAKAFAELLNARIFLYQNLYLQPSILILEGIVKLILKTYFVHNLVLSDKDTIGKIDFNKKDVPDLGEYKIQYCVKELLKIAKPLKDKKNIEIDIVESIIQKIQGVKDTLNSDFYNNLLKGWDKVYSIKTLAQLKALEKQMIVREFTTSETADSVSETARDVSFRIPGAVIIELRKLPTNLAVSDSRKVKERSDGTKASPECILVPDGHHVFWNSTSRAAKAIQDSSLKDKTKENLCVYLYPLSGDIQDTRFKQAVNLFDKISQRKG